MFITALRALLMLQSLISIFHLPWASFYSTDTWNLLYFRTWVFCSISLNSVPLSPHSLSPKPSLFLKCSSELDLCMTHHLNMLHMTNGLPRWSSGKETACQCKRLRRRGFSAQAGKILWNRKWQPTPVFLPGESHGQRSLLGYSPWGCKQLDMTKHTHSHTHTHTEY